MLCPPPHSAAAPSAIVIHEADAPRGIGAENRWPQNNLPPDCTKTGQALIRQNDGGIYDHITLVMPRWPQAQRLV